MPGRVGPRLMRCPDNNREILSMWINKGWFEWETEGYPHWSNLRHVQTWWNDRNKPNILFVHYNDLLTDLEAEIRRIVHYLDIECPQDTLEAIADPVTFKSMKRDAEVLDPNAVKGFKGGANTFFIKGTNGRWRGVLTDEDLVMYDRAVARELSANCHRWLEHGRLNS